MKTNLIIKRGNPLFLDESPQSQALFNALRTRLEQLEFDNVWLLPDKIQVSGYGVTKSTKYPKNVSMKWLFKYLDTFGAKTQRAEDYKETLQPVERWLKLARAEIKCGGTIEYESDDVVVVRNGTFEARMWGLSTMRPAPRADIDAVVRDFAEKNAERLEYERLKRACAAHGVEL